MDRKLEKRGPGARRVVALVVVAGLALATVWSVVNARRGGRLRVHQGRLEIATVRVGEFRDYVPVTGTVVPIVTQYIDCIEGGVVEAVYLEEGSYVEAGDEIAELSNTGLMLDVLYREAELAGQSNNLRNTKLAMEQNRLAVERELLQLDRDTFRQKRVAERMARLIEKGLVSQQEYEESQAELEYLIESGRLLTTSQRQDSLSRAEQIRHFEESLHLMESNLSLIRRKLEDLVIRAPVTGMLSELDMEVGQVKSSGERLGQIDVMDGYKIRVAVDEHYINRVRPGLRASFTTSDDEQELVVEKIYPRVVSGRFDVDLAFAGDEPNGLRQGRSFQIRLQLGDSSTAVLIPQGGFLATTGGRWVYLLDDSGRTARRHEIVIGNRNPQYCEVLEGLSGGDRVIVSSYDRFGEAKELILE